MSRPVSALAHKTLAGGLLGTNGGCLRTPLTVEVVNVGAQRHFSLTQYKRLQQKRNLISSADPNVGPDADFLLPDREVLGNDPEVNKTLNKYKIVPMQEAFRNLHLRGLLMRASGKTDKSKALRVPVANDDFTVYYGERAPAFVPSSQANVIPLEQYKLIVKEMKDHMSNIPAIVVHDGAVGSHPKYEVRARVMSDDPTVGLYLHHVMPRVSIKTVGDFHHDITVYIASKFHSESLKSLGIKSERYILADVARGIVVIGGPISTSAIRAGIAAVAQPKFFVDRQGVPVDASIVGVKGSEHPILVFGNHPLAFDKDSGLEAYGTHNAAWTKDGLVRLFDGVTVPLGQNKTQHGDFVEEVNGVARATSRRAATTNIHPHPSALVFLVNDSSHALPTISQVSPDYVSQFMLAGFSGGSNFKPLYSSSLTADPHGVSASIGSLAKQHNANVYVVNLSAKDNKPLSNDQVAKLLKAVASGSAKDAPVLSNVFSKISPLTSIKGLDLTIDPTKRGWDSNGLKTAATQLEKSISDYLSTSFPPPPPPPSPSQTPPPNPPPKQ